MAWDDALKLLTFQREEALSRAIATRSRSLGLREDHPSHKRTVVRQVFRYAIATSKVDNDPTWWLICCVLTIISDDSERRSLPHEHRLPLDACRSLHGRSSRSVVGWLRPSPCEPLRKHATLRACRGRANAALSYRKRRTPAASAPRTARPSYRGSSRSETTSRRSWSSGSAT